MSAPSLANCHLEEDKVWFNCFFSLSLSVDCTSGGCWVLRWHTPAGTWNPGWWSRCCRTEPSQSPGHSRTLALCLHIWSGAKDLWLFKKKKKKDNPVLTRSPLYSLTMVLQRESPSGSVRFPPYATGSWSGSMWALNTSCQLPADKNISESWWITLKKSWWSSGLLPKMMIFCRVSSQRKCLIRL